MPSSPPIVESKSPDIENIESCHRLGIIPPSVEPTMAPIQMRRLELMGTIYSTGIALRAG